MDVGNTLIDNIKSILDTLKGDDQPLAEVFDSPTLKSEKFPFCFIGDSGVDSDYLDQKENERIYSYKVWVFNEYDSANPRTSRRTLRSCVDAILNIIDQQESVDSPHEIAYGLAQCYQVDAVLATLGQATYDEEEKLLAQEITVRIKVSVDIESALINGPVGIVDPGHAYIADAANYYTKTEVDNLLDNLNLTNYYTKAEVDILLGGKSDVGHTHLISDITGLQTALDGKAATSHTHTASQVTDFSEAVDDRLNALLQAGSNISLTYNDTLNTLTVAVTGLGTLATLNSIDISSNTNLAVSSPITLTGDTIGFDTATTALTGYLLLTGGSITGDLTINKTTAAIRTGTNQNLNLIPNGTGFTIIGDAGTTDHSLNTNDDLVVSGRLEVNATTFLDETLRIYKNGDAFISANPTGGSFVGGFNTNMTLNQMVLFVDTALGRQVIIANLNFRLNDFDHATQSNPTLYMHSITDPDVSNNQWGSIAHNQEGFVIATGANTGAGTGATTNDNYIMFSPRGTEAGRFSGDGTFTHADAKNIAFGSTTGTKIGTATSQKISLWNATPIVQPTTAIAAATFVANTSGIANDTATFDGYTIGQIVKALRNFGALA